MGVIVGRVSSDGYNQNTTLLLTLLLPAAAYLAWQSFAGALTQNDLLDGSVGVMLGLYICSHPAANGIDLLFYERGRFRRVFSETSGLGWLALNAFIMFVGWVVIVFGAARFTGPGIGTVEGP